jgi:hypothetical protein
MPVRTSVCWIAQMAGLHTVLLASFATTLDRRSLTQTVRYRQRQEMSGRLLRKTADDAQSQWPRRRPIVPGQRLWTRCNVWDRTAAGGGRVLPQMVSASMVQPDGETAAWYLAQEQAFTITRENTGAQEWKSRDQNKQGSTLRRPSGEMTRAPGREPSVGQMTPWTIMRDSGCARERRPLRATRIRRARVGSGAAASGDGRVILSALRGRVVLTEVS